MLFQSLNLNPAIVQALTASGYTDPTPVQAKAIPEAIAGHDLMCSAPTGTGKTAAFVLPALQRLAQPAKPGRGPRVLVLTPTRELALQVTAAVEKYSKFMPRVRTGTVLGGMPYPKQRKLLESPLDILVATPGRLIDFIDQGKVDFSRLELLVLDEADRMLDMGFIKPVERIAGATPAGRQTLLFSATLDGNIATLAKRLLKNPKLIECEATKENHDNIEQRLHYVDDGSHKHRILDHLLRDAELTQAIVFTATKHGADRLAAKLNDGGHTAAALHGNMNQSQRNRTLARMRSGNVRVLVATDVAARGIDVASITHVINYDLPKVAEDYVHRIGRTGRAGNSGIAISFAAPDEGHQLKQIERYTGNQIERHVIAGMEPKVKPRSGAPSGNERKRFGDPRKSFGGNAGKPRSNARGESRSNSGSSWGGKSFGGNGGRPSSRDGGGFGGNRSRGRG
jgi:superfamily II DNA/RNA helicase